MNIGEVCSREVYVVRPDEPLSQAAREMCRHNIGTVVVVEQAGALTRPVGIVTDRDIVRGLVEGYGTLESLTASAVMAPNPFTLQEDSGIAEAIEELSGRDVRRAPVVSSAGDLVGIVSVDDLLPLVAEELGALTKLIERQARPVRLA